MRSSRDKSPSIDSFICSTAVSGFACASYGKLRLVLWLFSTCIWDVLRYRILIKTAFVFWAKHKPSLTTLKTLPFVFLISARFVSLVTTKKLFWEPPEISLHEIIRVFCSNAESLFVWADYQRLRLVVWFYVACLTSHTISNIRKKQSICWRPGQYHFASVQSFWWFPYKFLKRLADATKTKTQTIQSEVVDVPKNVALSSVRLVYSVVNEKAVASSVRDQSSWSNTCFGCVISFFFCFSNLNPLQNWRSGFGLYVWSFFGQTDLRKDYLP